MDDETEPGRSTPGTGEGSDLDLPSGDALLGMPLGTLMRPELLRSLAMIGVAAGILLWPDRTDRVLGILVGIALAIYGSRPPST
jgi:hypothetical protein